MPPTTFQWLSLVVVIWLQAINGTNSNFPAYSSQLKSLLGMSQLQLNNLAFASDAGKLFGWLSGIAAVHLPLWIILGIGSVLGLIGYGVQYLFIADYISSLSYLQVFLLTVLAGNSICWINTVSYIVIIKNFPLDHQVFVGLTTSYSGLSAKIYTDIVNVITSSMSKNRAKAYLMLSSILPFVVCIIAAPFVRDTKIGKNKIWKAGIIITFVITVSTGMFAVFSSLWPTSFGLSPLSNTIGTWVFLVIPLVVPLGEKIKQEISARFRLSNEMKVYDVSIDEKNDADLMENGVKQTEDVEEEVGEMGVKLMMQKVEFWLYFFVYFFGATLGLVYLNNLGQISESRGCSKTSSIVSLSSSFGFFGRLVPSLLDYFFSRSKYMVSRPAMVAALMAPMAGAFFLLLDKTDLSLFVSTAIIGVCTGAIVTISVSMTTELFGSKNFGINHNVVVANIPIGSFLFGYFAALAYRREANGQERCMGSRCYEETFLMWGSLCLLGTLCAVFLYARTRKFYSQLL